MSDCIYMKIYSKYNKQTTDFKTNDIGIIMLLGLNNNKPLKGRKQCIWLFCLLSHRLHIYARYYQLPMYSTDTNQSNRSGYTLIIKKLSKTYVKADDNLGDIYCVSGALCVIGRDDLQIIGCMYSLKAHQLGTSSSEHLCSLKIVD